MPPREIHKANDILKLLQGKAEWKNPRLSPVNKSHDIIRVKVVQDIHLTKIPMAENKIDMPEKSAGRLWRASLIFKVKQDSRDQATRLKLNLTSTSRVDITRHNVSHPGKIVHLGCGAWTNDAMC